MLLVGRQEGHPACKKNWVVGCWRGYLSGARCRLIGFAFLVPAHLGSPGKRAVKRVCVIKDICIAQVCKGHKCAVMAETAVSLRNYLCLYSYLHTHTPTHTHLRVNAAVFSRLRWPVLPVVQQKSPPVGDLGGSPRDQAVAVEKSHQPHPSPSAVAARS